jgi:hypothetical protein
MMDFDIKNICVGIPLYQDNTQEEKSVFVPLYKYSNGETKYFIQEIQNQQLEIKQFNDNVNSHNVYPFFFETENQQPISKIRIKCNNTKLYFDDKHLVSSNFILVEIKNNIMNIWNYEEAECNILQTNGNSICDGYMINDFENKKIKVAKRFLFREWKYSCININDIEIYGNNNDISFSNNFVLKSFMIKSYGSETNISFQKNNYDNIKINLYDSSHLNFNGGITESLFGESYGISSISNISICGKIDYQNFGLSKIDIKKI